ncbi:MAG: TetR/AcrR family transcriptional regulator [Deltaproteobacteria bacterium]|nr:TetR/AcrR family transcriptional regulator [Deltaproteobacteria bacterium]MBW2396440.1 TetR/AcrR family transcriptional regulator [Deltaproteobacteria bacterium]
MGRAALSEQEIQSFRDRLVEVATRLFVRDGHSGVTLRAIAREMGCSPMTPYRYFRDRDEIFAAVRASAYQAFADAQEAAITPDQSPLERLAALGEAYVTFAIESPDAYRLQFSLSQPSADGYPEVREGELLAWMPLLGAVQAAVASGDLEGDPQILAHLMWSSVHGLVSLHLAGKLVMGPELDELLPHLLTTLMLGSQQRPADLVGATLQGITT